MLDKAKLKKAISMGTNKCPSVNSGKAFIIFKKVGEVILRISIFTLLEEIENERGYPEIKILFPLIFGNLLWLIYALNIILKSDFKPVFIPIISFIKIFVAEKVAKSLVG